MYNRTLNAVRESSKKLLTIESVKKNVTPSIWPMHHPVIVKY